MRSTVGKFPPQPLREELFDLHQGGLSEEARMLALSEFRRYVVQQQESFLGYQANQCLEYSAALGPYLNCQLNNLGDPFQPGNFTLNSKRLECAVLDYYARLWHAKPHNEEDPESYWGYVVSMGSSEANLYGLWNARDYLEGKVLLDRTDVEKLEPVFDEEDEELSQERKLIYHRAAAPEENRWAYSPVVFYSEDSHYSINKAAIVLKLKTFYQMGSRYFPGLNPLAPGRRWPEEVPSKPDGSMDMDKLAILVEFFAQRGYPILVCFNYGTTFKGAYDDVEEAGQKLMPIFERYGLAERKVLFNPADNLYDTRTGYWFHVDGALGAAYMPFREMACRQGKMNGEAGPKFDFELPFVHSIAMSGHKWIGAPWPCGIYMTRRKYQLLPPEDPAYVGARDTTFAGSRNGFSALLLWDYLARYSYERQIEKLVRADDLAEYAERKLLELASRLGQDLWVERSPRALTVRFKKASDFVISKYSLSGERVKVHGEWREYSHIFLMEHVTGELVDDLIGDLEKAGSFPEQVKPEPKPGLHGPTSASVVSAVAGAGRSFR